MLFSDTVKDVVAKHFPGANPQFYSLRSQSNLPQEFLSAGKPRTPIYLNSLTVLAPNTLKPLLKPTYASCCVFASYVLISKYLCGASLRIRRRDRENAALQTAMACKTKNHHVNPLSRGTMGGASVRQCNLVSPKVEYEATSIQKARGYGAHLSPFNRFSDAKPKYQLTSKYDQRLIKKQLPFLSRRFAVFLL